VPLVAQLADWISLIRSRGEGAEPYDAYNHADSSWKIPRNTTTVILNFVDSAVKLDFVPQLFDWISLIRSRTRGGVAV